MAQPANDGCAAPVVIGGVPFTDTRDTTTATTVASDPLQSCTFGGPGRNTGSVWYRFIPASSGPIAVDTLGSSYDTVLTAYTGGCASLAEVTCNDDTGVQQLQSRIILTVTAGTTYLFEVTAFGAGPTGQLQFSVKFALPPGNDNCGTPTVIPAAPFTDMLDTSGATTVGSDPLQSCSSDGPSQNSGSVWYRFTPASSGPIVVDTLGSSYDTVLTAYTGACGSLLEVACNDDAGDELQSRLTLAVTAGTTYLFEVTAFGASDGGELQFSVRSAVGPGNDDCGTPTVIADVPFTDMLDTTDATTAGSDPLQSCSSDAQSQNSSSVWYRFTPTSSGAVAVDTLGSSYDTLLTAYTGACGSLVEIACNDDTGGQLQSRMVLAVTAGTTYLFEVTASGASSGGQLSFSVRFAVPPSNDSCGSPTVIAGAPFMDMRDTIAATTAAADPLQSCSIDGPSQNSNSVWYQFTPPASGTVTAATLGSDYDTVLTANIGACGSLVEVACNDDTADNLQSQITFPITGQTVYLLEVTGSGNGGGGMLQFALSFNSSSMATPTATSTATRTATPAPPATRTPTPTGIITPTPTRTVTPIVTVTPTRTVTPARTTTPGPTATMTPAQPPTPTQAPTPGLTPLHLSDPTAAKAADKCQKAIKKAGLEFVSKKLKSLAKCANSTLKCIQTKPVDLERQACVDKAKPKCAGELVKIFAEKEKLKAKIRKKCEVEALDGNAMVDGDGLGYSGVAAACDSEFGTSLDPPSAFAVADCVARQHECQAEKLFDAQAPRAGELLRIAGASLGPASCLPDRSGGVDMGGAATDGEAIAKCAAQITKAGTKFVRARLKSLEKCVDAIFTCAQTKPDPSGLAPCLTLGKAEATCTKELGKLTAQAAKLSAAIEKKCGPIDEQALLDPTGANLGAAATACAALGLPNLLSLDDYKQCLLCQHECESAETLRFQAPRAEELLGLLAPPVTLRSDFCPTRTPIPTPTP